MKLATRVNSFLPLYNNDLGEVFGAFKECGLKYANLNYPEHTDGYSAQQVKEMLNKNGMELNGVNLRFRADYVNGELANSDPEIAKKAVQLCKDAADYCREAGGRVVTIWLGFDGFDYSFQVDYARMWKAQVKAFQEIADYAPDMRITIEYKPYEERGFAFIDSMGVTGMILNEANRDNLGITLDYCHMLMKRENPAYPVEIFGRKNKLFGIDFNDGYGLSDDGLMIGTATPFQILEFLYYVRKHEFDGVIYFDTFPVVEHPVKECKENIKMINMFNDIIEEVGMDKIQEVIDKNDATEATHLLREFIGQKDYK